MSGRTDYPEVVETARQYYNSEDADNFYFHVWGGEDIHIGLYEETDEPIAIASRRTVKHMASLLGSRLDSARVVDLGSGYGGSARYLAGKHQAKVTALNLSETENERHREMNRERGVDALIDVVDGSFEQIPLADGSADIAWSQDAILHSNDRAGVIKEVDRVLRPGGMFIFTDPMQAVDCPQGVLQPVLDRIHLETLGSFDFYKNAARDVGLDVYAIEDHTQQLITHYSRVKEDLSRRRSELTGIVSDDYIERMLTGLDHWVDAGQKGYLAWGIMMFIKPA